MRISDWSSDVCSSDLQAIGGVTSTFLPKSLTRCGLTHSRSRRLIVHKVRGTARSSACLSEAVLAPIGTAISDICVGDGALSVARGGGSTSVLRSQQIGRAHV